MSFFEYKKTGALRNSVVMLGLVLVTVLVYLPVRSYHFVNYDDDRFVTHNSHLSGGLSKESFLWSISAGLGTADENSDYWHPASFLSHALDIELFGMNAGGHHMMSVAIHAIGAAALFWTLFRLTGYFWQCAFVAALFAFHPLRVESVAWIAERKDVLSGLFFFLTLGVYADYARRPFSVWRYLYVVGLFLLSVMSKPIMITLPCVLLLLDIWPLERIRGRLSETKRGVILEKIPMLALSGILSALTWFASRSIGSVKEDLSFVSRLNTALVSYAGYIGKTVRPSHLAVFYPLDLALPFWKVAAAAFILFAITGFVFLKARRQACLAVGWLWYLGMLLPVSGLPVQPGGQAMADRYTYLSTIGLYIMVAWGLPELLKSLKWKRAVLGGASVFVLGACVWGTARQLPVWENSRQLFSNALQCGYPSGVAHNNLGDALMDEGRFKDALGHFRAALRLSPDFLEAQVNEGNAWAHMGKLDDAIASFDRALVIDPDCAAARKNRKIVSKIKEQRELSGTTSAEIRNRTDRE